MTTDTKSNEQDHRTRKVIYRNGGSGAIYGLGLIGALVYYMSTAATFWLGVLGVLKAIVWPAMLVYGLLNYLHL
jgi:hypothetical protein